MHFDVSVLQETNNALATTAVCFAKASTVLNAALYTALHPKYKSLVWKNKSKQHSDIKRCCHLFVLVHYHLMFDFVQNYVAIKH